MQGKESKTKSKKRKVKFITVLLVVLLLVAAMAAVFYFGGSKWCGLDKAQNSPRRQQKPVHDSGALRTENISGRKQQTASVNNIEYVDSEAQQLPEEILVDSELEVYDSNIKQSNLNPPVINSSNKNLFIRLQKVSALIDSLPDVQLEENESTYVKSETHTKELSSHTTPVDALKSVVRVSKRKPKDKSIQMRGSLQMHKIQLKLLVNDMRWALAYNDAEAFTQAKKKTLSILRRHFDIEIPQVGDAVGMLNNLNIENEYVGEN